MKLSKIQIGRADILRLLAVHRTASVDHAARMLGYEAETPGRTDLARVKQHKLDQPETVDLVADVKLTGVNEMSREMPSERFWYLRKRQQLQAPSCYLLNRQKFHPPLEGDSDIPAELQGIEPFRREELDFTEFQAVPYAMEMACENALVLQPSVPEHHATPSRTSPRLSHQSPECMVAQPDIIRLAKAISAFHSLRPLFDSARSDVAEQEQRK
ncbi:MAG: hypothetical protein D3924_12575, partial [Candidatus Electrothrix sp. AR4]|nr:hypothetical protein [Candidatus Electrothrix sp. AR4]